MIRPRISRSAPEISEQDLEAFESELGTSLPNAYRAFLIENNGGYPTPRSCCVDQPWGGTTVVAFRGIEAPYPMTLYPEESEQLPGTLNIADDLGGNTICLGLHGEERGQIFFWAHDEPEGANNAWKIADNFDDFLQSFSDEDDS